MTKLTSVNIRVCLTAFLIFYLCFSATTYANIPKSQPWDSFFKQQTTTPYPIIFIHGISAGFQNWSYMISEMGIDAYSMRYTTARKTHHNFKEDKNLTRRTIWNISYYTPYSITEYFQGNLHLYAKRLTHMINTVKTLTGHDKVILIAYSMGGLVAREYMMMDHQNWTSVHKLVTIATPHHGVPIILPIGGQLTDLQEGSRFLLKLNKSWKEKMPLSTKKWGVVGALFFRRTHPKTYRVTMTDFGGVSYIQIGSAIPFGGWEAALKQGFGVPSLETPNFGFRLVVNATHDQLLQHDGSRLAIQWAMQY